MKKFILLTAVSALLLPFAACNKGEDAKKDIVLPAPEKAQFAKMLVVKNPDLPVIEYKGRQTVIGTIEFTDGGRYIISDVQRADFSKADENANHITGDYSTTDGITYQLNGFGTVVISGNTITVNLNEGTTPISVDVTEIPSQSGTEITNLARSWKVDKIDLSVNLDGKTIGFTKNGCDLEAIVNELKDNYGMDVNPAAVAGFNVKQIDFSTNGTIEISFTGKDSFVGTYDLTRTSFSYNLEGSYGNDIFNGVASGSFELKSESLAWLTLSTNISSGSKAYSGRIIFILSRLN